MDKLESMTRVDTVIDIIELLDEEKKLCQKDCCKNHLTLFQNKLKLALKEYGEGEKHGKM